jgi:hypothetical protein
MEKPNTPINQKISTMADYLLAIDTVVGNARHHLKIFDRNLADMGFNTQQRYEALRSFLLGSRNNKLQIVVHDSEYISNHSPRMKLLLTQFSHAIAIHKTLPEAQHLYDPFIIADEEHYVHRFHYEQNQALMGLYDPSNTQSFLKRFDEIWEASEVAVSATTLGL